MPARGLLVRWDFICCMQAVYFTVARGMVNLTLNWSWSRGLLAGLANAVVGVALYFCWIGSSRERKGSSGRFPVCSVVSEIRLSDLRYPPDSPICFATPIQWT